MRRVALTIALTFGFLSASNGYAMDKYTGNYTLGWQLGNYETVFHYDQSRGSFERLDLTKGEKSTNSDYAGNYNTNRTYLRNTWRHTKPYLSRGILKMWDQGWTGKGVSVFVDDNFVGDNSHGQQMLDIVQSVAPEATVFTNHNVNWDDVDIWNQASIGGQNHIKTDAVVSQNVQLGKSQRDTANYWDALVVKSSGNSLVDNCESVAYCNQWAVGLTGDYNEETKEYTRDPNNPTIVVGLRNANTTPAGILQRDFVTVNRVTQHGGTSEAASVVSGAAALLMHKYPNLNKRQVKTLILETATGLGECRGVSRRISCTDDTYGHGLMNVRSALSPAGRLR